MIQLISRIWTRDHANGGSVISRFILLDTTFDVVSYEVIVGKKYIHAGCLVISISRGCIFIFEAATKWITRALIVITS